MVNDEAIHEDESREVLNISFCEAYKYVIDNVVSIRNYADNTPPTTARERLERVGLRILLELADSMLQTIQDDYALEGLIEYNRENEPVNINEMLKFAYDENTRYDIISYIDTFRNVNELAIEYNTRS